MVVGEYLFTEYYHKYVTIEADELTANLSSKIKITDKDCYALCSSYINEDGLICFNVLSVGENWENCTRGLKRKEMLGTFTIDEVFNKVMRVAEADYDMVSKNKAFLEEKDKYVDDEILSIREDARLDNIRDMYYPDIVYVGVLDSYSLNEYSMQVTGYKGPFLMGKLLEEPVNEVGIHEGEDIYALPYVVEGIVHLITLFGGDQLDAEEKKALNEIIQETANIGLDFNGISLKN